MFPLHYSHDLYFVKHICTQPWTPPPHRLRQHPHIDIMTAIHHHHRHRSSVDIPVIQPIHLLWEHHLIVLRNISASHQRI